MANASLNTILQRAPKLTVGLGLAATATYGISATLQWAAPLFLGSPIQSDEGFSFDSLKQKAIIHLAIPTAVSAAMTLVCRFIFRAHYGLAHFVALAVFTTALSAFHTGVNYLKKPAHRAIPEEADDVPNLKGLSEASSDTQPKPLPEVSKSAAAAIENAVDKDHLQAFLASWRKVKPLIQATSEANTALQEATKTDSDVKDEKAARKTARAQVDPAYLTSIPKMWDALLQALPEDIKGDFPYESILKALTYPRVLRNVLLEPKATEMAAYISILLKSDCLSANLNALLKSELCSQYYDKVLGSCSDLSELLSLDSKDPRVATLQQFAQAAENIIPNVKLMRTRIGGVSEALSANPTLEASAAESLPFNPMAIQGIMAGATDEEFVSGISISLLLLKQQSHVHFQMVPDKEIGDKGLDLLAACGVCFSSQKAISLFKSLFKPSKEKRLEIANVFDGIAQIPQGQTTEAINLLIEETSIQAHTNSDAWALQVYEAMMRKLGIDPNADLTKASSESAEAAAAE